VRGRLHRAAPGRAGLNFRLKSPLTDRSECVYLIDGSSTPVVADSNAHSLFDFKIYCPLLPGLV
jgi:hypothetical protein